MAPYRAGAFVLAALTLIGAALATAATVQQGELRVTVLAQLAPFRLPRAEPAPISVFVSGHVENPHGGTPPQLQKMTVAVNRHGLLQSQGLPVCRKSQLAASSTARALAVCSAALIGSGQFWARIVLPDQGDYPTHGRLLVFNGRRQGRPALLVHIYTSNPFDSSFLVVFAIKRLAKGPYGTELQASLPETLGSWGYVDRIKLTLKRKYRYRGRELSYFNSACPAPSGTRSATFPLALAKLDFAGGQRLSAPVVKTCGVKGP